MQLVNEIITQMQYLPCLTWLIFYYLRRAYNVTTEDDIYMAIIM